VPALAIADVLTSRGYEVWFCGGGAGMEESLVVRAGYPFSLVRIRGFKRRLGMDTLRTLASIPRAGVEAWRLLHGSRPACVVGVGAYASGPVVAEAAVTGVPTVAVEMDAHLGWTNRILALLVDRVCLSFPVAGRTGSKYVHTGRPIRPALLSAAREEGISRFGLDPGLPVVLVFGGSLGARTLNDATLGAYARTATAFSIIHVTGERDYRRVEAELRSPGANPRYQAHPYLDDFPLALAAATVAVCRAGGSVAELTARGVPALLVPFPRATADHQTKNALSLQAAGAAVMVPDAEFDSVRMKCELEKLLVPHTLERMGKAARAQARPDAATRIADEIVELAGPPGATP
jgi:UDP-N-acetylglucosamine--N-acetylmuramyl-(pentapeptide) pyrophosphoryl-undecaprenol N-acetylglucosamine transferase